LVDESLRDSDWEVRVAAAEGASAIARCAGAPIKVIVSALENSLRDEREQVRIAAVRALGELATTAPEAVQALQSATKDASATVRNSAVAAINAATDNTATQPMP
jgi:HEAT repeat protein